MSGFTYNGIHSSTYHVEHIPDSADRWFKGPEYEVYSTDVAWRHGGYYYGNKVNVRTFEIKCFFNQITQKQREQIRKWLGRNTSGQLVFDDLPFVYWNVRPTKVVTGEIYNDHDDLTLALAYSGKFTVTMEAYEPFGYLTRKYNTGSETDNANDYCDLLPAAQMPAAPTTSSNQFDVYNPGTEACGLSMVLAGTIQKEIRFLNDTNKTRCGLIGLPGTGSVLDINGDTGNITVHLPNSTTLSDNGFAYHESGYITLEPGLNSITILEKNENDVWITPPTALSLTSIAIDYHPRIL